MILINSRAIKKLRIISAYSNTFFVFVFNQGNGYITTAVLREILKELDDKITAEELDMMISEIDSDGSGTVDFDGNYRTY